MQAAKNLVSDYYLGFASLRVFTEYVIFYNPGGKKAEQVKPHICKTIWYLSDVSVISCCVKCSLVPLPQRWCSHYHPHGEASGGMVLFFCCWNLVLLQLHISILSFITVTCFKGEMKQQAS